MGGKANAGWQELQIPSRRQCPKLFYSFSITKDTYTLLVTDLISIWESAQDKDEILSEAVRQNTSIDPSVSSDQFEVLLSKLRQGLTDDKNVVAQGSERDQKILLLRTRADLPRPLKPLEWTFTLRPQTAAELAEHVLRPSLHEVAVSQDKITSLLRIIKDKDHVISRLLDRVGNSGVDLSLIFPGITGFASRKGGHLSVSDAKKHVAGMAGFDEPLWTRQFANDDGYEGADRTGLSNLVRGCEKCFAHSKAEHEGWIAGLPSVKDWDRAGSAGPNRSRSPMRKHTEKERKQQQKGTKQDKRNGSAESDDEFERQPTPPHLQSKRPAAQPTKRASAEMEDTDDDAESSPKRATPSKMSALGRRSATKAFGVSKKKRSTSPRRRPSTTSTATATASSDEGEDDKPTPPRGSQSAQDGKSPKAKLGALGRKKGPTRVLSLSPSRSRSAELSHSVTPVDRPSLSPPDGNDQDEDGDDKNEDEDETEDETEDDDLDPSSPPPKPPPSASTPSHARRLGRLGRDKPTKPTSDSDVPSAGDSRPSEDQDKPAPSTASPTSSKKKIGRLGGLRRTARKPSKSQSPSQSASRSTSPSTRPKKVANAPAADSDDATDSPSPSRASPAKQSPPPERHRPPAANPPAAATPEDMTETAEDKADRRRMELKRTIAQGTGKKKRRF